MSAAATQTAPDVGVDLLDRLTAGGLTVLAGDVGELVEGVAVLAACQGRRVLLVLPAAAATVAAASGRHLETWLPDGAEDAARDRLRIVRDPGDHDRGGQDLLSWVRDLASEFAADLTLLAVVPPTLSVEEIEAAVPGVVLAAREWPRSAPDQKYAQDAVRTANQLAAHGAAVAAAVAGDAAARIVRAGATAITYSDYVTIQRGDQSNDQTFGSGSRRQRVNLDDSESGPLSPVEIVVAKSAEGEERRSLEPLRDRQGADRQPWKPGDTGAPAEELSA